MATNAIKPTDSSSPGAIDRSAPVMLLTPLHNLFRNLPKLSVKAGMIVRIHSPLECFGCARPVKEAGSDPQCADLIPGGPSRTDLVYLASHVASSTL